MDFSICDEHMKLIERAKSFIENDLKQYDAQIEEEDGIDLKIWRKLVERSCELGLYAPFGPKVHGVGGIESNLAQALFWEAMGQTNLLFSEHMVGKSTDCLIRIKDAGMEGIEKDFIIPMLRGEKIGPFAGMTEPGAGSDMRGYKTTAVKDGNNWILNGTKIYISGADLFDWGVIAAVIDSETRKQAHFCVSKDMPGLEIVKPHPKWLGVRGMHHVMIKLNDCVVPDAHRGIPYAGQDGRIIDIKRGASMIGAAQKVLDHCVEFVKTRETFGRPLAANQFIQFELAESAMEIHAARLVIYQASWKADQGEDFTAEAAMSKITGSEVAERVARRAMRCMGARAQLTGSPVERLYRDAAVGSVAAGSNEMNRLYIARSILGRVVKF